MRTTPHARVTNTQTKKGATRFLSYGIIGLIVLAPITAQAGFFSDLIDFIRGPKVHSAFHSEKNSQNIELLQAAINHDPNPQLFQEVA